MGNSLLHLIPLNNTLMNLTITKEKVLAAAETCSTVKTALKAMFPEAFEKNHKFMKFGQMYTITYRDTEAIYIGRRVAKEEDKGKTLIINEKCTLVVTLNYNRSKKVALKIIEGTSEVNGGVNGVILVDDRAPHDY